MDLNNTVKEFIKVVSVTYVKTRNNVVVRDEVEGRDDSSSSSSEVGSIHEEVNFSSISIHM